MEKFSNKTKSKTFLVKDYYYTMNNMNEHFSVGIEDSENPWRWQVVIFGPKNTLHEDAVYNGEFFFPENYPDSPPRFKFNSAMFHPNIEPDGTVCISILHESGDDVYGYETEAERWKPIYKPGDIIMAIVSILDDPNCESPANLDAAQAFLHDRVNYDRRVKRCAADSLDNL